MASKHLFKAESVELIDGKFQWSIIELQYIT